MQSRILLRGYAREGGTPSLATHPQNQQQHQEQNQNQEQHQNQNQNQNQLQNQGRLHRGLDTPDFSSQTAPVGAQFFEQDGAEHHVAVLATLAALEDRKSTRLNSSHGYISYAVF